MKNPLIARLFVMLQFIVPQHLLSRITGRLAASESPRIRNWLIRRFIAAFDVDMSEAAAPSPADYRSFNAFFTRALRDGARPVEPSTNGIASPADGHVSQAGPLLGDRILQAKDRWYTAAELLGSETDARDFAGGTFATIYLSPRDYHRVHMPVDGRLRQLRYIPGKLFSVNQATAAAVPGLFARNERLVCLFDTAAGPLALVMVGAMIVAGIETIWTGPIDPGGGLPRDLEPMPDAASPGVAKGAEIGRFQLGSTVILLFGADAAHWEAGLSAGASLRMGQRIGCLSAQARSAVNPIT